MLRAAFRADGDAGVPSFLAVRWAITVYLSLLGAQLFAYLFDLNTRLTPPESVSWSRYYLDPFAGPKTLYGAVVVLPLSVAAVSTAWGDLRYRDALRCWTPALMAVLASARVGCWLQSCCYGRRLDWLGVRFPSESSPALEHARRGVIELGEASLRVFPTQAVSALALLALAVWSLREIRRGAASVFPRTIALYAVFRFALETMRDDPERNVYGLLSTSQWISLAIVGLLGTWRLAWYARRPVGSFASPR